MLHFIFHFWYITYALTQNLFCLQVVHWLKKIIQLSWILLKENDESELLYVKGLTIVPMVELESIQRFISFCSFIAVFIAPFLTIGSLSKSVKWNLYNSGTDYGYPQFYPIKFKLYAYQNLWSFYDAWHGPHDHIHSQSYKEIINGRFRKKK